MRYDRECANLHEGFVSKAVTVQSLNVWFSKITERLHAKARLQRFVTVELNSDAREANDRPLEYVEAQIPGIVNGTTSAHTQYLIAQVRSKPKDSDYDEPRFAFIHEHKIEERGRCEHRVKSAFNLALNAYCQKLNTAYKSQSGLPLRNGFFSHIASVFEVEVIQKRQAPRSKLLGNIRAKRHEHLLIVRRHAGDKDEEWNSERNFNSWARKKVLL